MHKPCRNVQEECQLNGRCLGCERLPGSNELPGEGRESLSMMSELDCLSQVIDDKGCDFFFHLMRVRDPSHGEKPKGANVRITLPGNTLFPSPVSHLPLSLP